MCLHVPQNILTCSLSKNYWYLPNIGSMRISALLITKYDIQSSFLYRLPRKSLLDRVLPVDWYNSNTTMPAFLNLRTKEKNIGKITQ